MNNKKGLGRGLGELLSVFDDEEEIVVQKPQKEIEGRTRIPRRICRPICYFIF